jgi:SPP1 family predicted phage head-tail adaptor
MINAGYLNTRATLQRATNSNGEINTSWSDIATVWAWDEQLSGNKLFQSMNANSRVIGQLHIRYRKDLQAAWRIKIGSRYLAINSIVDPNNKHEEQIILYEEWLD